MGPFPKLGNGPGTALALNLALRGFVANRRRRDVRELRGKGLIRPDCDYKSLREGR